MFVSPSWVAAIYECPVTVECSFCDDWVNGLCITIYVLALTIRVASALTVLKPICRHF
jgi:hypothetical protein